MSKRDAVRERRIRDEIVVDAYGAEERAMSWYYYLEDQLGFPFTAICIAARAISPPGDATDPRTSRAVADWHYWVRMAYEF